MASWDMTLIEMGTSCMFSTRFVAVTIISSRTAYAWVLERGKAIRLTPITTARKCAVATL